jgi:hypothetical protein
MDQTSSLLCTNPVCFAEKKTFTKEEAIDVMGQLCCPSCQQPLEDPIVTTRKQAEKKVAKYKKNIKLIASISAVVLLIVAIVFFIKRSNSNENEKVVETKKVKEQPKIKPEKKNTQPTPEAEPIPEPEPEKVVNQEPVKKQSSTAKNNVPKGMQTLSIGGNTYKGEVLNGKPHGMGTMYYRKSTQISPKDLKNRMAENGDYLTGEFYQGYVVQGKLFDSNNNVKEVVMIGR